MAISMRRRATRRLDLLAVPVLGRFLRWQHARSALQVTLFALSLLILYDGWLGPQLAPKNLAGVLPWVHWRGLVVLSLLGVGNLFCMGCPFMLPRRLAKRLLPGNRAWPRWLPGKWLAIGLLVLFFWSYEAFDLWSSPWLTAWVVLAYFALAFVIDGVFVGASFCKHICPIGQFNFVNSLVSPVEVSVRDPATCATCVTKDCIRGRYDARGRLEQRGCELFLFQPRKAGNMDCTFCLDCVQACPHGNVSLLGRNPIRVEFGADRVRSGIGRWSRRTDLAALVLVVVFGGFINAFGMVSPVYALERWVAGRLGVTSELPVLALLFAVGLVILPLALVAVAAWASRRLSGSRESLIGLAARYSYSLAPIGFGMWLAHYQFHFLTGALTIVPLAQSFVADLGRPLLGEPRWDLAALLPGALIEVLESVFLVLGLAGSIWAALAIAESQHRSRRAARRAAVPWVLLSLSLFGLALWLMSLPMEMRGVSLG